MLPEAARVWYRSSVTLSRLAELAGADYYHFLQPNQYVPDAKPLSSAELEQRYRPDGFHGYFAGRGYALLREFNGDLQRQGVNYFDLTEIFADNRETLYKNECCHLNGRGNELLAAAMVRRLTPALRRLGQDSRDKPVSPLAAARRPPAADLLLVEGDFQVYRQGDIKGLRYVRADCAPADTTARFFLHLTPRDLADLPPHRQGHGFDNRDFSFGEAGGRFWRGQCLAQIRLPDYPITYLRTGQYAAGPGGGFGRGVRFWGVGGGRLYQPSSCSQPPFPLLTVIPAQAGIQKCRPAAVLSDAVPSWIPACAGMTVGGCGNDGCRWAGG